MKFKIGDIVYIKGSFDKLGRDPLAKITNIVSTHIYTVQFLKLIDDETFVMTGYLEGYFKLDTNLTDLEKEFYDI